LSKCMLLASSWDFFCIFVELTSFIIKFKTG
jgi:hypothetical protein